MHQQILDVPGVPSMGGGFVRRIFIPPTNAQGGGGGTSGSPPIIRTNKQVKWTGAYPLAFSTTADLSTSNAAFIMFITHDSSAPPPACVVGGVSALLMSYKQASNGGTGWCWLATGLSGSTTTSVTLSLPSNYCGDGIVSVVGLSGVGTQTNPGMDAESNGTQSAMNVILGGNHSLVLSIVYGYYAPMPVQASATPATINIVTDSTTDTNQPYRIDYQTGTATGTAVSLTYNVSYNVANGLAIEVQGQ